MVTPSTPRLAIPTPTNRLGTESPLSSTTPVRSIRVPEEAAMMTPRSPGSATRYRPGQTRTSPCTWVPARVGRMHGAAPPDPGNMRMDTWDRTAKIMVEPDSPAREGRRVPAAVKIPGSERWLRREHRVRPPRERQPDARAVRRHPTRLPAGSPPGKPPESREG